MQIAPKIPAGGLNPPALTSGILLDQYLDKAYPMLKSTRSYERDRRPQIALANNFQLKSTRSYERDR